MAANALIMTLESIKHQAVGHLCIRLPLMAAAAAKQQQQQ
jgi:hypothetical protein